MWQRLTRADRTNIVVPSTRLQSRGDIAQYVSDYLTEFRHKKNLATNTILVVCAAGFSPWCGNDVLLNFDYKAGPYLKKSEWLSIGLTGGTIIALAGVNYGKMHDLSCIIGMLPPLAYPALGGVAALIGSHIQGYDAGYPVIAGFIGGVLTASGFSVMEVLFVSASWMHQGQCLFSPVLRSLPFVLVDSVEQFLYRTGISPISPDEELEPETNGISLLLSTCSTVSFTTLLGEALQQAITFGLGKHSDYDYFDYSVSEEEARNPNDYRGAVAGLMLGILSVAYVNRAPIKATGERVYTHMSHMLTTGYNRLFRRQEQTAPVSMTQMLLPAQDMA